MRPVLIQKVTRSFVGSQQNHHKRSLEARPIIVTTLQDSSGLHEPLQCLPSDKKLPLNPAITLFRVALLLRFVSPARMVVALCGLRMFMRFLTFMDHFVEVKVKETPAKLIKVPSDPRNTIEMLLVVVKFLSLDNRYTIQTNQ